MVKSFSHSENPMVSRARLPFCSPTKENEKEKEEETEQALISMSRKGKLQRLPRVFNSMLELPLPSNADVVVEEDPLCFRFIAEAEGKGEVEVQILHTHLPDLTKVVVREGESALPPDFDVWCIRLPESTEPEVTTAVIHNGMLVVTVPKGSKQS